MHDVIEQRYTTGLIKDRSAGLQMYVDQRRNEFIPNWLSKHAGTLMPNLLTKTIPTYHFSEPSFKFLGDQFTSDEHHGFFFL
mmetsp:Transcript_17054/g.20186  ORF Transcript_17054/g.20186 Transcript_17054/m.20186 type:complete len:82 (-) Transcript_17054:903-1148(-)